MKPQPETAGAADDPAALAPLLDALCLSFLGRISALPKAGALTLAQWDLLCWTGERGVVTWREARTRAAGLSRKPVRALKTLARRGLLKRCKDQQGTVHLCLSAAGRTLLSCREARERRCQRELFRHLSAGERNALTACLRLLLPPERI